MAELRQREADAVLARWAERCQTIERARARLSERQAAHTRRLERHAAGAAEADAAARERELETAERELASADGVLDAAREALAGAEHSRSQAARNARELRRTADALAAEIRVLEGLIHKERRTRCSTGWWCRKSSGPRSLPHSATICSSAPTRTPTGDGASPRRTWPRRRCRTARSRSRP